jgi:hypothetical protein
MSSAIIVCGVSTGAKKKFSCPCCHWESDNIDSFATGMCWPCVMGNLLCEACIERGVAIDRFRSPRAKLHRFARWKYEQSLTAPAVTCCGLEIERDNIGQGVAVLKWCRRCWPDGETWE